MVFKINTIGLSRFIPNTLNIKNSKKIVNKINKPAKTRALPVVTMPLVVYMQSKTSQNNLDKNISVIASGDPSIYGIGRYLSKNIEHKHLNIVSGISSLQYIFSRIFVDMNDVYITSSHGKVPDFDYILSHKKLCMVTDSKIGPHEISREIKKRNLNKTIVVGENLSYEDEKITIGKPEDILAVEKFDMNVVVILDEE